MITQDTKYKVKNRSAGEVVYSIPESNLRRSFAPGETKVIPFGELEKLTYQSGGRELLSEFLQIMEEEVTDNLNIHREVEYNMSPEDVRDLLIKGTLDEFIDALHFAPLGVIDLIKTFSVQLPLTDLNKRRALKEETGFDVDKALMHLEEEKEDETAPAHEVTPPVRRVQPAAARRVTSKYKVVNKQTPPEE